MSSKITADHLAAPPLSMFANRARRIHILIREMVCDLEDARNEAVLLIHWTGGRHRKCVFPGQDRPLPRGSGASGRR
jgi:hypothetical protein